MDSTGKRLRYARKGLDLTQTELAESIEGVSRPTINRLENDVGEPMADVVMKVCRRLGVSMEWLLTGEWPMKRRRGERLSQEEIMLLKRFRLLNAAGQARVLERIEALLEDGRAAGKTSPVRAPERVLMKVYDVSASAGPGFYLDNESTYELIGFAEEEVPDDADFGMKISGNSMEPLIQDRETVWVKSQPDLRSGQIGIFIYNNELLCKEFYRGPGPDPGGEIIRLKSRNPDYRPIDITEDDSFSLVGLVLI